MKPTSLSVCPYLIHTSPSIVEILPPKPQLSSRPSYPTYVRSTDVRTRITTFVTP